jgi:hypothetical protein
MYTRGVLREAVDVYDGAASPEERAEFTERGERPEQASLACLDVAVGEGSGLPDGDDAAAGDGEGFWQQSERRRKEGEGGVPWWASVDQRPLIHGCNVICCEYLEGTPRQGTKVLVLTATAKDNTTRRASESRAALGGPTPRSAGPDKDTTPSCRDPGQSMTLPDSY